MAMLFAASVGRSSTGRRPALPHSSSEPLVPPSRAAQRNNARGHAGSGPAGGATNSISFVSRSAIAPYNVFTRDGLFTAGGSSRTVSHALSPAELQQFPKVLGYMPRLAEMYTDAPTSNVQERVADLDDALRARVQSICDRLQERQCQRENIWNRCSSRWCQLASLLRLGVLREIWREICFYFVYSICLQFYAHCYDWDFRWSAANQDTIYYPALVMSFLLSFRASDCMLRYQQGHQCVFRMEKHLREMAFEVLTKLSLDEGVGAGCAAVGGVVAASEAANEDEERNLGAQAVKKRYFKHEFRRLSQALFTCAARDLNDSAGEDASEEEAARLPCSLTDVELSVAHITHSSYGHVFRVYVVAAWLAKLVRGAQSAKLFDDDEVWLNTDRYIRKFKEAWMMARQVAYSRMPDSILHLLWLLANTLNLVLPWEYVSVCRWLTWLPSIFISVSFFGIVKIAANMENPFGSDDDDIPIWDIGAHLDEEISLLMFYAALDEVGGENLYRTLTTQDHIYVN